MNEMNCHHVFVSLDTKQRGGCLKASEKINFNIVNNVSHDTIFEVTVFKHTSITLVKTGYTEKTFMSPHLPYLDNHAHSCLTSDNIQSLTYYSTGFLTSV